MRPKRTPKFRALLVRLECDCVVKIDTSRYRVSKSVAGVILGHYARKGKWCFKHNGMCQIEEFLGVVPTESEP